MKHRLRRRYGQAYGSSRRVRERAEDQRRFLADLRLSGIVRRIKGKYPHTLTEHDKYVLALDRKYPQ
jgi:hypothetical protein